MNGFLYTVFNTIQFISSIFITTLHIVLDKREYNYNLDFLIIYKTTFYPSAMPKIFLMILDY